MINIKIIRGQNQIGGSIIEISSQRARIIFDIGVNLDEQNINIPSVDGLFDGKQKYDAVFISHYHSDHVGLIDYVSKDIPVYMGEKAIAMVKKQREYMHKNLNHKLQPLFHKNGMIIKDLCVFPLDCDHSAYNSFMFIISDGIKKVLYTGDFRANGRMQYDELLKEIPEIDLLITEGTTLSRDIETKNIPEIKLESIGEETLKMHSGPAFIVMSAMNADRLTTAYNIAQSDNRILLEDLYTASIAVAAGKSIPNPVDFDGVRVFMTSGDDERYKELNKYGNKKIGKNQIAQTKYIMCIRPSMINYLSKLNELQAFENGILFYGLWKGYQEKEDMSVLLKFMKTKGVKIHTLHTSGHADAFTIDELIEDIKPKVIMPVHTENSEWFEKYGDNIEVIIDKNEYTLS